MQRINTANSRCRRRMLGVLAIVSCVAPAWCGQSLIDKIAPETQATDSLCWAAVSVMALQAFKGTPVVQFSQQQVLDRAEAAIRETGALTSAEKTRLQSAEVDCANFQCGGTGEPWLGGLHYEQSDPHKALVEGVFVRDIAERARPIIIAWDYSNVHVADLPGGSHYLIVTGYDDADPEHRLRVFDPWPTDARAGEMAEADREPLEHVKWISYEKYKNPVSDHGLAAIHSGDHYKMRRGKTEPMKGYPATETVDVPQQISQNISPVDFLHAINDANLEIRARMHGRVVLTPDGSRVREAISNVDAIPVVALPLRDLLQAAQRPQALLGNETNTLLVPVLAAGRIVDSFLMMHGPAVPEPPRPDATRRDVRVQGSWHEGGYSNNRIANVARQLRDRFASGDRPRSLFYLVSIPERGAFFLAVGFGEGAEMVSLNNGGRDGMRPARDLLRGVIEAARSEASRPSTRHERPDVSH